MADDADLAQAHIEMMDAFRSQQIKAKRPVHRAYDWCVDCGDRIDPRRLKAIPDAERCSECQNDFENYLRRSE